MEILRRLCSLSVAAFLASVLLAGIAPVPADAGPMPCAVTAKRVEPMPDGATYALVLHSQTSDPHDLRVVLFSESAYYAVMVPGVGFGMQTREETNPFYGFRPHESAPVFVRLPSADAVLAVRVDDLGANGTSAPQCAAPYAWEHTAGRRLYSESKAPAPPIWATDRKTLLDALAQQPAVIAAERVGDLGAPACATPYAPARTLERAKFPNPPPGSATSLVIWVLPGGYADAEFLQRRGREWMTTRLEGGARPGTYAPAVFRCEQVASEMFVTASTYTIDHITIGIPRR